MSSGSSCIPSDGPSGTREREELDLAREAIRQFAELKSPWTTGHVHPVTGLLTGAATRPRPLDSPSPPALRQEDQANAR
jgi:hypothetical protein